MPVPEKTAQAELLATVRTVGKTSFMDPEEVIAPDVVTENTYEVCRLTVVRVGVVVPVRVLVAAVMV